MSSEITMLKLIVEGILTEDLGKRVASVYVGFRKELLASGISKEDIDSLWATIMKSVGKK